MASYLNLRRAGRICQISGIFSLEGDYSSGWNDIFTITDPKFENAFSFAFVGIDNGADATGNTCLMELNGSGVCRVYKTNILTKTIRVSITYIGYNSL